MSRRKYTKWGEKSTGIECSNKKCKWQGADNERAIVAINSYMSEEVCPKCGNNEFLGLLDYKTS